MEETVTAMLMKVCSGIGNAFGEDRRIGDGNHAVGDAVQYERRSTDADELVPGIMRVRLTTPAARRTIGLTWRNDRDLPIPAARFRDFVAQSRP